MSAKPIPLRGPQIQHDGLLTIAVGKSRKDTHWKNQQLLWSTLLQQLADFHVTGETLAEYRAMPKSRQDDVKDVGGFVGGELAGGRRKATAVKNRHIITLDADTVKGDLWSSIEILFDFACAVYSTHSHTPDRPRLRIVIPLSRPVTVEEYQAVARRLAGDLGIDQFDPTTFEAHRLMYWPSCPVDVEPVFHFQDLPWLDPDTVLARYPNWRDPSYWPEPQKAVTQRQKAAERQEDPHKKPGIVGAFCRTYSIEEAIEAFLSDIYEPAGQPGRYTYVPGTTTGGLVVYDDGKFAYSHHGTDPISGKLVNAFDLVRLHKFGHLDDEATPGTPTVRLPSYSAMCDFAAEDGQVKETLGREREEQAKADFGVGVDQDDVDTSWMGMLEYTRQGAIKATRDNILIILENDPRLKGKIALNEFTGRPAVRGDLPWREASDNLNWQDRDDAALRHYLERLYNINSVTKTHDALESLLTRHRFHPVREYLRGLTWDEIPRVETLLIDLLGADDTPYVRAVTRKAFAAAVARIMQPGCKYDHVLVLVGPQGIGKSLLLKRLGRDWFSDSLTTMNGREAYEQLQGVWIMEISELAATRKAEVETIKHFISKQEDIYRVAYGRQVSVFPRQCVFFGTTNTRNFLRDATGNRRFWPVECRAPRPSPRLLELSDDEIDQIWAEAVAIYDAGETLYLTGDLADAAVTVQEEHREESERAGAIRAFLDLPLPGDWDQRGIVERREYIHGGDFGGEPEGTFLRDKVCVMEIWVELFNGDPKALTRAQAAEIHDVLRTTPGWEERGKLRFGTHYGIQRAYVRVSNGG